MSARNEIRRQLGNMPTGQYRLSGQEFIVRRVEPKPVETQETFEWKGIVVCMPEAKGSLPRPAVLNSESFSIPQGASREEVRNFIIAVAKLP